MSINKLGTVIIFGYGPNLGVAIANKLLKNNYSVIGINRSGESYGVIDQNFKIEKIDLTNYGFNQKLYELLFSIENFAGYIYNLSISKSLEFDTMSNEDLRDALDASLFLLNSITKLTLPRLIANNGCAILTSNATSSTPWLKFPTMGITKSAMESFQKTLSKKHPELKIYTVKICSTITDNSTKYSVDVAQQYLELFTRERVPQSEVIVK